MHDSSSQNSKIHEIANVFTMHVALDDVEHFISMRIATGNVQECTMNRPGRYEVSSFIIFQSHSLDR